MRHVPIEGVLLTDAELDHTVGLLLLREAGRLHLLTANGGASGLSVEAFAVPAGPPRFAPHAGDGHTVGFIIRDRHTGSACAFVPGCGALDAPLLERLGNTQLLLFDGTFWTDDELIALGIGTRTARQMDHVPISGEGGSLQRLARLRTPHRVYTHINNTNPMLLEGSPQRRDVSAAGMTVGMDGMRFTI
jgi:pyrroloquinoline quinone biosynthesis protein B